MTLNGKLNPTALAWSPFGNTSPTHANNSLNVKARTFTPSPDSKSTNTKAHTSFHRKPAPKMSNKRPQTANKNAMPHISNKRPQRRPKQQPNRVHISEPTTSSKIVREPKIQRTIKKAPPPVPAQPQDDTFVSVCESGDLNMVKNLLAQKQGVEGVSCSAGLLAACAGGHIETVRFLLWCGVSTRKTHPFDLKSSSSGQGIVVSFETSSFYGQQAKTEHISVHPATLEDALRAAQHAKQESVISLLWSLEQNMADTVLLSTQAQSMQMSESESSSSQGRDSGTDSTTDDESGTEEIDDMPDAMIENTTGPEPHAATKKKKKKKKKKKNNKHKSLDLDTESFDALLSSLAPTPKASTVDAKSAPVAVPPSTFVFSSKLVVDVALDHELFERALGLVR